MPEAVQTSKDYSSRVAENRACPGVLMFNVSMRVLWADRRAWALLRAVDERDKEKSPRTRVPTTVKEIGEKAFALLKQGRIKKTDSPLIRKILNGGSLLICGFGLPDTKEPGQSRVLMLLERIGRREEAAAQQAKAIFRLTEREVQVV